jgi:hypothetical protein
VGEDAAPHGLCSDCLEAQMKEADKANGDAA